MAGSCCGRRANVAYEVDFKDGRKQTYDTVSEAQSAMRAAQGGTKVPTMKAVPK